jgi:hypothetical protein
MKKSAFVHVLVRSMRVLMGYIVSRDSLNFGYVCRENIKHLLWSGDLLTKRHLIWSKMKIITAPRSHIARCRTRK